MPIGGKKAVVNMDIANLEDDVPIPRGGYNLDNLDELDAFGTGGMGTMAPPKKKVLPNRLA